MAAIKTPKEFAAMPDKDRLAYLDRIGENWKATCAAGLGPDGEKQQEYNGMLWLLFTKKYTDPSSGVRKKASEMHQDAMCYVYYANK